MAKFRENRRISYVMKMSCKVDNLQYTLFGYSLAVRYIDS